MRIHRGRRSYAGLMALSLLVFGLAACTPRTPPAQVPTGAGSTKIRYGPFTIPDMNSPSTGLASARPLLGLPAENGMVWNQPVRDIRRPCDGCLVTSMQAGLEYADGTVANIDTGAWLHHMVLMSQGTDRRDPTCSGNPFSLPHFAVGGTPENTERFFASGNERTALEAIPGQNYGYRVNAGDRWHLLVDLMNTTTAAKTVYLTMNYSYVPASTAGYRGVQPIWLDAAQCGTSEVPARTGAYTVKSNPYTSTVSGQLIGAGGHLHDGGTHLTVERNGQVFCDGAALYGTKPGYTTPMAPGDDMDHSHGGAMTHISEHPACRQNLPTINAGDRLSITGFYDDAQHPQMVHGGRLHTVMAIAILYVAE
jgi:hypothetical protein